MSLEFGEDQVAVLFTEMFEPLLTTRNVSNHVVILGFFRREKMEIVPEDGGTDFGDNISMMLFLAASCVGSICDIQPR